MPNRNTLPVLLAADDSGRVFDISGLKAAGMRLNELVLPEPDDWIPMPEGSDLMRLPDRAPIGYDHVRNRFIALDRHRGLRIHAVAAFMAPAHTQIYRAAYQTESTALVLPLFAYTPVGWKNGRFWVTGIRVDPDIRHDPSQFDRRSIDQAARKQLKKHTGNRLVDHLVHRCVREYHCPNAQNFVLGRWECPLPISPGCNAECIGCISKQSGSGIRSTQDRIPFVPTVEELYAIAVPHLETADRAMVSFGQGCEGEPLMHVARIEKAIKKIRRQTTRGTIHLNTHGGDPVSVERLFHAGLDSMRVSMNSAQNRLYNMYHRPKNYGFEDVMESMRVAKKAKGWVSLNYFIFPGLTDSAIEMASLAQLLETCRIDCIQMRNLNIDPEWYVREMDLNVVPQSCTGMRHWRESIHAQAPWIRFGYFNPPKEDWDLT
jgi:pyruvate-formate lyase-activating enzyme